MNISIQNNGSTKNPPCGLKVPEDWLLPAKEPGSLKILSYDTPGGLKKASVYLPSGYDVSEKSRYNILYLLHGALGNETTYLGTAGCPSSFKNFLDNLISSAAVSPFIVCTPTIQKEPDDYHKDAAYFYREFEDCLISAAESKFSTYASGTDKNAFASSRDHRAFGGFSAGSTTTWNVFLNSVKYVKNFLPMSGATVLRGDGSLSKEKAALFSAAVLKENLPFSVFAATGTKDVAYRGLSADIREFRNHPEAFTYTETGFDAGNLTFYVVSGNEHKYPHTYEYIYNALVWFWGKTEE